MFYRFRFVHIMATSGVILVGQIVIAREVTKSVVRRQNSRQNANRYQIFRSFSRCPLLGTAVLKFGNKMCRTSHALSNSILLFEIFPIWNRISSYCLLPGILQRKPFPASQSAFSFPSMPLWPGTQQRRVLCRRHVQCNTIRFNKLELQRFDCCPTVHRFDQVRGDYVLDFKNT